MSALPARSGHGRNERQAPYVTRLNIQYAPLEADATRAPERAVTLMVEGADVVPTGDK